jgi:hypothetical protein
MSISAEPTIIPDSSSYMELAGTFSGQPSSPAESAIGDSRPDKITNSSWRLDRGPDQSGLPVYNELSSIGFDHIATALSDTHPDVVASLIAEYITDTILRIDSGAVVDLSVTVKQDLVVVTGEVGCSHPAKSAIIHSDHFMGTLNGSVRDILKDIGVTDSPPPTVSSLPPTVQNSPLRKPIRATSPGSPQGDDALEEEAAIDPALVHIILAITDSKREPRSSGVCCEAVASDNDLNPIARRICTHFTKYLRDHNRSLVGGVSVDVLPNAKGDVHVISVAFFCPSLDSELVNNLAEQCLSKEYLKSVSHRVHDDTVVEIRHSGRGKASGRNRGFTGKSWDDARRYGQILARQEALHLVKTDACSKCEIRIRLGDTTSVDSDIHVLSVNVNSFGTSKNGDAVLAKNVLDRCSKRTIKELQESTLKEPTSTFFALDHGGSLCSAEFIVEAP